jgi:hypothetical protein
VTASNQELHPAAAGTAEQKTCGACEGSFLCCAYSGPCWCEQVKPDSDRLAKLRESYRDCLCPRCLAAFGCERVESGLRA